MSRLSSTVLNEEWKFSWNFLFSYFIQPPELDAHREDTFGFIFIDEWKRTLSGECQLFFYPGNSYIQTTIIFFHKNNLCLSAILLRFLFISEIHKCGNVKMKYFNNNFSFNCLINQNSVHRKSICFSFSIIQKKYPTQLLDSSNEKKNQLWPSLAYACA